MTTTRPENPVALEAWLEERLTEKEAAAFVKCKPHWLANARTTPGAGPKFKRYSAKLIVYVRRDLIAWGEQVTHGSTLEYREKAGQLSADELEASAGGGEGEDT